MLPIVCQTSKNVIPSPDLKILINDAILATHIKPTYTALNVHTALLLLGTYSIYNFPGSGKIADCCSSRVNYIILH